jgi:hypothetical protein
MLANHPMPPQMIHRRLGISPKGTGYCLKELAKREILGVGSLSCSACRRIAKIELDNR